MPVTNLNSVSVEISVVLGRSTMPIQQLLRMGRGAVIELNAGQDEEVVVLANNRPIARGEIMIQGERIAVSITRILKAYEAL